MGEPARAHDCGRPPHESTLSGIRYQIDGADQVGANFSGNSCAIDPMGVTLAAAGETETVILAEISAQRLAEVRTKLPSVRNRRPDVYILAATNALLTPVNHSGPPPPAHRPGCPAGLGSARSPR